MAVKHKNKHSKLAKWWRRYEYKHTTLAILAIAVFLLALDSALVQALLVSIKTLGLGGIFIAGILFVSFFTAAPAVVLLVAAADNYHPMTIAIVAGAGSIIGDWIILKLFEEKVAYELVPLAKKFGIMPIIRLLKRKVFQPVAITLGIIFVASPLPDEAGLALLGLSKLPLVKLLFITFLLNAIGILALAVGARLIVAS